MRENCRPDSDIDLLLRSETDAHLTLCSFVEIEEALTSMFERDVDWRSKGAIQLGLNDLPRKAILNSAEVIYDREIIC